MKLILYTLFDVSPAGAFLENTLDVVKGLPASTDSKKQLNNHPQKQSDRHLEASDSESAHGVKKRNSVLGSTQHGGGGRILKVFRRISSKSKRDMRETDHSNASSSDRDISCSGDVSSDSLFEIEGEGSPGLETYNADYHDGKVKRDPQFRENPLESEVEVLKRRLEKQEEEVQKLKDELSSLRSSSGSSQVESPRSHSGTLGFDSLRAVSPSESSRTSITSDPFDGESQIFFEFRPSDDGQLVKLVQEKQTRGRFCKPQVSDGDVGFANVEKDVPVMRHPTPRICNSNVSDGDESSANAEKEIAWVSHSSSGLERGTLEHLDTFLSDVAALNKHGTLEKYTQKGVGFDFQPEGPRGLIMADQCTKEKKLSLEVVLISEKNCSDEDAYPLEHAPARKQDASLEHEIVEHDECPSRPAEENQFVGVCCNERVESGKLQVLEDSERLSQEIGAHPRKTSIMDLRVHDDNPELAEIDRGLNGLRERSEKLMKILLSPRRDNSYDTTSSSSGTSSLLSVASTSPRGPFMMTKNENSPIQADVPENGFCNASVESLAPVCESGMQESRVAKSSIDDQIQNLDLSSPRDILASKFESLVRTRSLDLPRHICEDVQAEISEEAVDTTPSVAGEVYFHPTFSRGLSFSVLTGYKQQRERTARERETSPAVAIDPGFRLKDDKPAGKKRDEHANVHGPALCGPSGVPNTGSDCANGNDVRRLSWTPSGSRLTRFGEEAAKLQSFAQAGRTSLTVDQGIIETAPVFRPNPA